MRIGKSNAKARMHPDMRPPVNRAMRTLDRSFFKRVVPMSAARFLNNKDIAACRSHLMKSKDALDLKRASALRHVPGPGSEPSGLKCLLLDTNVKQDGMDLIKWKYKTDVGQIRHLGARLLPDWSRTGG
jgi:hypothetical protein